jgi:putative NADH-flavin reductase
MKLTIIAATGGIGQQLVRQALAAGHDVTAVARDPGKLPEALRAEAQAVAVDLAVATPGNLADLEAAFAGADAVLSGLGPKATSDAGITTRGTRAIIEAMRKAGVRRLVVVSAAPVGTVPAPGRPNPPRHDPGDGFFMRQVGARLARTLFGAVYADLAEMEDLLRDSGLDWTVVRPPRLTDRPLTARYRTAVGQNVRGGWLVSRADVAHFMLAALDQPQTIDQVIGIAN